MAWAIFHERFLFDRRPAQALAFHVQPSDQPQSYPRDVVDAAIAAGRAKPVKAPSRHRGPHSTRAAR